MSLKHLRTLIAIADHRTFSEAADSICLTHAAVSQHVSSLEEEMGVPLFDRVRRTPVLNATGRALVQRARVLLRDYDELYSSVLGRDRMSAELVIGAIPTVLTGLAPKAILRLRQTCPGLKLQIKPGLTSQLITAIERSQLDAAIVTQPPTLPATLTFQKIADEPLMLITSQETESSDVKELLNTQPFIRFNRDAVVGAQIEAWLQSERISVNEAMELSGLDSIATMVHANIGVSIVPKPFAAPFNPLPLKWMPLENGTPSRCLGLVHRQNTPHAWALEEIRKACGTAGDLPEAQD